LRSRRGGGRNPPNHCRVQFCFNKTVACTFHGTFERVLGGTLRRARIKSVSKNEITHTRSESHNKGGAFVKGAKACREREFVVGVVVVLCQVYWQRTNESRSAQEIDGFDHV